MRYRLLQIGGAQLRGQVEPGAGRGGDRDSLVAGGLGFAGIPDAMDFDPRRIRVPADHDDLRRIAFGQVRGEGPEVRGGVVVQVRARAAGEDGRHLAGEGWHVRAEQVDATMERSELARFEPAVDLAASETELQQLPTADHAVLPPQSFAEFSGAIGPPSRTRSGLTTHTVVKLAHINRSPCTPPFRPKFGG